MPVTERVMALGDWSLKLRDDTPFSVRNSISTPFSQIVITSGRLPVTSLSDAVVLSAALFSGVILRPGPQYELGGCSLAWYIGDDLGGAGYSIDGWTISAGTLSSAVSTVLSGSAFTAGTIVSASVSAWTTGAGTRRDFLTGLAQQAGYEWRINPDRTIDVNTTATLYGSTPTAVIVRRNGSQEVLSPYGITGDVSSTWDYEDYGSKVYLWTNVARGEAGGASPYRDPAGTLMTIVRGREQADAAFGTETGIAQWWVDQLSRPVRTVEVTSDVYAVTGLAACGTSVWLYDRELGLYDTANQVQYGGSIIFPVSARVVSVTWPVERGMGVYVRAHDGTNVTYVDLSDWIEWESAGARYEISTGAQHLTPSTSTPIADAWRPWTEYDATIGQVGGTFVLGNGTKSIRFRRPGVSMEINGLITMGSTTVWATGQLAVLLPSGVGVKQSGPAGVAYYTDASTGNVHTGMVVGQGGTQNLWMWINGSPAVAVDDVNPMVWAAGDTLSFNATLEVAT